MNPERWTLANGMTVFYRRDEKFPLVCATLLFRVGSRHEKLPEAGLCSLTVDLLMQGTRHKSARELARIMESVGASMGTQVHEDYSEMGFVVPAAEIDRAFNVLTEVLHEPSFPKDEIIKEKAHILAALSNRRDTIFTLACDHLNGALYGNHPYGRPLEGREATVKTFARQDCQSWHRHKILPRQGILSLVGPFPAQQMQKRLQKTIGAWNPREEFLAAPLTLSSVPVLQSSRTLEVKSSFEQAYLMVGRQAPCATHEDQIPLKVLNTLLGGGMSSRLFVTLREKLSLAYEVSSYYPTRQDLSQWVIYLGLPTEKLKTASQKLEELLQTLAFRGPTPDEVRQAKAMIRGAFLMDRQSRRRQGWYQAWWEFLGRDVSYGQEFLRAVDAVTPKQLQRLIRTMMDQPKVTVTVVPDQGTSKVKSHKVKGKGANPA